MENVYPNIYRIQIPLPNNPLKATNSYFIRGHDRNLLVDNGFNCPESRDAMLAARQELGFQMETTDLFITHLHSDHSGLTSYLATPDTTVWMSAADAGVVGAGRNSSHWQMFRDFLHISGLLASGVEDTVEKHPGYQHAGDIFDRFTLVEDGDPIQVGSYCFHCLQTKGHTPGHMCLYEPRHRLLLSGDHILGKITPNITLWNMENDVLGEYLESLDKVASLKVDLVLPGHRYILTDCRGRIEALKAHHERRLEDVLRILGRERMNGVQVASRMKWDLSYRDWKDFPWGQKLFATGEAMSHLYHLVKKGVLTMSLTDGVVFYERKSGS